MCLKRNWLITGISSGLGEALAKAVLPLHSVSENILYD
jgi:NAD(P)-dependent dehydrogenase (short-subunit alcohol dehydrogenase family)